MGALVNDAMDYLAGDTHRSGHCVLVVLDEKEKLWLPTSSSSSLSVVIQMADENLDNSANCGSMVVVAVGSEAKSTVYRLPRIHRPVIVTPDLDWVCEDDQALRRLEPIFFTGRKADNGFTKAEEFAVYDWGLSHEGIVEVAVHAREEGYHLDDGRYSERLVLTRHTHDFGGRSFPAVAFHFHPYSVPDFDDQANHAGFEYEIAAAVAESLNLRLVVSSPSSGGLWGSEDEHGNYSGEGATYIQYKTVALLLFPILQVLSVISSTTLLK